MPVKTASLRDHKTITRVSKMSKYTAGFTNIMFSGEDNYKKGWIGKYVDNINGIVGFICLRHAVRKKRTIVYDVGVDPRFRGLGVGRDLIQWAMDTSPYGIISLNVDDDNKDAIKFYRKLGFKKDGIGTWGSGKTYTTWTVKKEKLK